MATTRLGIHVPADLKVGPEGEVYHAYNSVTDMGYTLHETTDGVTALIGTALDSVGLVTWWRTGSLEEGMDWIDMQVDRD